MSLLEVSVRRSGYGRVAVLHDVEVSVDAGEMVVVLGHNGVGKTTLLRTISGVSVEARAEVRLDGERLHRLRGSARARRGIAHVPEGRHVFGGLTVHENLLMGAVGVGVPEREARRRLPGIEERFPVLSDRSSARAASLSGGEQQMLAIGRALMSQPAVLLVDEASLGLSPVMVVSVFEALASIRDAGTAVLVVEQNTRVSLRAADRGYVLERGTVALQGLASELAEDPRVAYAYLGGGADRAAEGGAAAETGEPGGVPLLGTAVASAAVTGDRGNDPVVPIGGDGTTRDNRSERDG